MPTGSNVVDSSAWLEYLSDGPNASEFARVIEDVGRLMVPALVITEVARRLDSQGRRRIIPRVVGHMRQGHIVPLDEHLALHAATVGRLHRLALADSIVYATALVSSAVVWTQDRDFKDLPHVEYRPHQRQRDV